MTNAKATLAALLTTTLLMAGATVYLCTLEPAAEKPAAQRNNLSTEEWRRLVTLR